MEHEGVTAVIADCNIQDRESKQIIMEKMGINIILSTGNGSKVLEAIKTKKPDIVVMDMILPGIDGMGILEELSKNEMYLYKPVILIETALKMENLVKEALQSGADYYMMKPVSGSMLVKRIFQLLDRNQDEKIVEKVEERGERKQHREIISNENCRFSGDLEMDITNILLEIGIPAHIKGYQYIREGIIMSFYDRNMLHYITKFLYPSIAQKYKTTSSSVERTIRHAIEIAWRRGNIEILEEFFGNTVCACKGKPTNSEFMALLTDKLRLEYRSKSAC